MTTAAIYARVSSARQKEDQTIASQTAALQRPPSARGLRSRRLGLRGRGVLGGDADPSGARTLA